MGRTESNQPPLKLNGKVIVSEVDNRSTQTRNLSLVSRGFKDHTSGVLLVVLSPDGSKPASGSWDKTVRLWDTVSGAQISGTFKGHTNSVQSVAFSSD